MELKEKRENGVRKMFDQALQRPSDHFETAPMFHRCLVGGELPKAEEAIARYELSLLCVPTSTFFPA